MVAIKLTVPKRIGGVKLPKPLRRSLKKLSKSKDGRAKIAEGLVAAGGFFAISGSRDAAAGGKAGTSKTAKAPAKSSVKRAAPTPKPKGGPTPRPLSQPLATSDPTPGSVAAAPLGETTAS